jgi:hypothetical protein
MGRRWQICASLSIEDASARLVYDGIALRILADTSLTKLIQGSRLACQDDLILGTSLAYFDGA